MRVGERHKCQVDQKWRGVMKFSQCYNWHWWKHFNFLCQSECKMKTPATSDASDSCTRQALLYLALHVRSCQSLTVAHCRMCERRRRSEPRRTCEMFIIWRKILGTLLTFHRISSLSRFTKSSWLCLCDWQTNEGQGRVSKGVLPLPFPTHATQLSACLPFGFSMASSCRTIHSIMKKVAG